MNEIFRKLKLIRFFLNQYRWFKIKIYNSKKNKDDFLGTILGFICVASIIIIIWLLNFLFMPIIYGSPTGVGTAGDMFGGITALFSGLAFAGLITTLFMQRRELELQRRELKQTREVFSIQRFENTFFGLINLLNNHIRSIEVNIGISGKKHTGRDALENFSKKLPVQNKIIQKNIGKAYDPELVFDKCINQDIDEIRLSYENIYSKSLESDLGPYFRLIYNILKLIENTNFDENSEENLAYKKTYAKLLRAHLNSSEVKLLMFNCASYHGKKLKPWVVKYSLLKHITNEVKQENSIIAKTFPNKAFGI